MHPPVTYVPFTVDFPAQAGKPYEAGHTAEGGHNHKKRVCFTCR